MRVTVSFLVDPHSLVESATKLIRESMDMVRTENLERAARYTHEADAPEA